MGLPARRAAAWAAARSVSQGDFSLSPKGKSPPRQLSTRKPRNRKPQLLCHGSGFPPGARTRTLRGQNHHLTVGKKKQKPPGRGFLVPCRAGEVSPRVLCGKNPGTYVPGSGSCLIFSPARIERRWRRRPGFRRRCWRRSPGRCCWARPRPGNCRCGRCRACAAVFPGCGSKLRSWP